MLFRSCCKSHRPPTTKAQVGCKNEADIFANQIKHVRPLKPYEIFMANIENRYSLSSPISVFALKVESLSHIRLHATTTFSSFL